MSLRPSEGLLGSVGVPPGGESGTPVVAWRGFQLPFIPATEFQEHFSFSWHKPIPKNFSPKFFDLGTPILKFSSPQIFLQTGPWSENPRHITPRMFSWRINPKLAERKPGGTTPSGSALARKG